MYVSVVYMSVPAGRLLLARRRSIRRLLLLSAADSLPLSSLISVGGTVDGTTGGTTGGAVGRVAAGALGISVGGSLGRWVISLHVP